MRAHGIAGLAAAIGVLGCASTVEPPSKLPGDVARFVERRQSCDHFRGEEPYSPERRAQLEAAAATYCRGTDRELAALRSKYRGNAVVLKHLDAYESNVNEPGN